MTGRRRGWGHTWYIYDFNMPQQADLIDTIAQLQFEIDVVKFAPPAPVTSATWIPPARPGPAAVPTMKVPKFSWDMKGDDRPDETIDSGMGTLQSRGTILALESRLLDTVIDRGARDVDASTPVLRQNYRIGPRSGVRPRLFGHDMLTPIPDVLPPPMPGSQLGSDFVSQQQTDLKADLLVTIAQLQSEVRALKLASPVQPKQATRTQPARRRSATFTNTAVPKFREVTCWDQYRQVLTLLFGQMGGRMNGRPTAPITH